MRPNFLLLSGLICTAIVSHGVAANEIGWEKSRETDGIVVYEKKIPGSSLLAFKGQGVVDAPLARVVSVMMDVEKTPEWLPQVESARKVRVTSSEEFISHSHIATPFVLKDRDFVTRVRVHSTPERFVMEQESVTEPSAPETRAIRGELRNTRFTLTSIERGTRTRVEGEIHCDPKGSVPRWVVNFFQRDWPVEALRGLRKQVAK